MSKSSYDQEAVASVYARALYPLADEKGATESLLEELEAFAAFQVANPEFDDFLSTPLIPASTRDAVLEKVFQGEVSDLLLDTLHVLNRRDRCGIVPALAVTFRQEFHLQAGQIDVEVHSPAKISEKAITRLDAVLRKMTGKKPNLTEVIDEDLIGGLVVHVEDLKYDLSLANDLRVLEKRLLNRASEEICGGKYLTV